MSKNPKIVSADGRWDALTSERRGGYWLGVSNTPSWFSFSGNVNRGYGIFNTKEQLLDALASAPPVPADAVWDEDSDVAEPQPSLAWKPIAETREELRGMGETLIDAFVPGNGGGFFTFQASRVANGSVSQATHWTIIPRPKPNPAPTVAELERAVVEAAIKRCSQFRYNNGEVEAAVDALLAYRERAKGGGK